eukprot:CAMPEP_0204217910 /NCGR_PEP_ID=MMETSP0361-20130328/79235_1 /ASSEMBLY_ACC=CAM_ASM_000343 /TAXON_ID=268821 /ORGANISM="Scrippsiella Hangoei, Strain SHTV-5" /LENGTH=491 /DNA_ID=CAMNT_0051182975 /DNA_START=44 /DNA_END=1515 /DNA_ORIENTATION=+
MAALRSTSRVLPVLLIAALLEAGRIDGSAGSPPMQYAFGRNWQQFLGAVLSDRPLSGMDLESRLRSMEAHLQAGFDLDSFAGRTFLDVGCGSGLASLAALRLGAARVVSLDYQQASVETTRLLRKHVQQAPEALGVGNTDAWEEVLQGSILDQAFVNDLPRSDLVYSYGVLHHTGDVWGALRNIAPLAAVQNGLLLVSIHVAESVDIGDSTSEWLELKKEFNQMLPWEQEHSILAYAIAELGEHTLQCVNASGRPAAALAGGSGRFAQARRCLGEVFGIFAKEARGMDFITDAHDWLGGYPYDWVRTDEVIRFMRREVQPSMKTLQIQHSAVAGFLLTPAVVGESNFFANGQFQGHWASHTPINLAPGDIIEWQMFDGAADEYVAQGGKLQEHLIEMRSFATGGKTCWVYFFLPEHGEPCRQPDDKCISPMSILLEDMEVLGWGGDSADGLLCSPDSGPRYQVLRTGILFSPGDGSDPRFNGRSYRLLKQT